MGTRNPFEAPEVVSRRGGPVKQPLSRDAIVAKALEQLTRDGLESMSLRKVAAALETGPASLYVYINDLDELHALVFDRALARVDVRGGKQKDWRERVKGLLVSYLEVLLASPGLAQLAFRWVVPGPNTLRLLDALLGAFAGAGIDGRTAAWTVDLLLLYVNALAAEQGQRVKGSEHDPSHRAGAAAGVINGVSPEKYPHVHAARQELVSGDESRGKRVTWALDSILSGVVPPSKSEGDVRAEETKPARSPKRVGRRGP